jgi:hypothetical protein
MFVIAVSVCPFQPSLMFASNTFVNYGLKKFDNIGNSVKLKNKLITTAGNTEGGKYHCTIDLLFDWFGISCMTTDNFCFYLQNRLIQTSQTGGQLYSDTSPFSIP